MSKVTVIMFIMLLTGALAVATADAEQQRTVLRHGEAGAAFDVERIPGQSAPVGSTPLRNDNLLWQRHIDVLIYASCGIAPDGHYAGTTLGNPAVVENLDDDGLPSWVYAGQSGETWAHRGAIVEPNESINGATVRGNYSEESGWAWRVDIPNAWIPALPVRQTRDGSRVVVILTVDEDHAVVYTFAGSDGTPISEWHAESGLYARALSITEDGGLAAMRGSAIVHVIDTTTGARLWFEDMGASANPLSISPDGHWLTSGWQNLMVWERVGDGYEFRWADHPGNIYSHFLGACAVNSNGDIVGAWYSSSYRQTKVQMVNADIGAPGVMYEGLESSGEVQEFPIACYFDDDSNLAAVGNWGDANGVSPEVLVFQYGDRNPVAWLDTPGSIFALDGQGDMSGGLEIVACGKAVHANQFGNSGDYYKLHVQGVVAIEGEPEAQPELPQFVTELRGAHPNPFNPMTTISFSLDRQQQVRLSVFDLAGKRVADLVDGVYAAGDHPVVWNGQDLYGREVASGTYMIYLEAEDQVRASKMTLAR